MAHPHHAHDHGPSATLTSLQTRRLLAIAVGVVALLAVVGAVVLRPDAERPVLSEALGFTGQRVHATVTSVVEGPCRNTVEEDGIRCDRVQLDITSGPTEGERGVFEVSSTEAAVNIEVGDALVVQYEPNNPRELRYFFHDFQRERPLLLLAAIFGAAVVALGRWQGVRALTALGVTGVVLVGFAFPSILDGKDPTAVALVAAAAIAILGLYLTHGITDMITVALLGSLAALSLIAVLAIAFTNLASFTGYGSEDAYYLQFASAQIDVKGLILAGIIVGSLGVLDDVTVSQVSSVWQLHAANPAYSARQLYAAGVTIGRDHIAATVNTLVLAYAGASLPLLLVFAGAGRSLGEVAVGELVAVEVVRTLVGSIGLVAAVPLTTGLAAFVVTRGSMLAGAAEVSSPVPLETVSGAPLPEPEPEPTSRTEEPRPEPSWEQFAPEDPDDADRW